MDRYKILKKGLFQSLKSFEEEINALSLEGWRVVSSGSERNQIHVILERKQ